MTPLVEYELVKDIPGLKAGAVFIYDPKEDSYVHQDKNNPELAYYYDKSTISDPAFFKQVKKAPVMGITSMRQGADLGHPDLYSVIISNLTNEQRHRVLHGTNGFLKGRLYSMGQIEQAMVAAGMNEYRKAMLVIELTK